MLPRILLAYAYPPTAAPMEFLVGTGVATMVAAGLLPAEHRAG